MSVQTVEEKRAVHNAYMREWKRRNPEKVKATNRAVKAKRPELYREINRRSQAKKTAEDPERFAAKRWKHRAENPREYLCRHARNRAAKIGVPFDLLPDDLEIPEFCPVLGIKLEWSFGQRASRNTASPSLDRIIPELGYVRGNVVVVSNRANHLKNNGTPDELRRVAEYAAREDARARRLFGV